MGVDFRPYELKDKFMFREGRVDRKMEGELKRKIRELSNEFKRNKIKMDKSDNKMLELAFFTAMEAINRGVSTSSLRKMYNEIKNIKSETDRVKEGKSTWDDVIALINKARFSLAYMAGRTKAGIIYDIMDEALRKATEVVEGNNDDEEKFRIIESLHFFAQAIIAFHKFLGGK